MHEISIYLDLFLFRPSQSRVEISEIHARAHLKTQVPFDLCIVIDPSISFLPSSFFSFFSFKQKWKQKVHVDFLCKRFHFSSSFLLSLQNIIRKSKNKKKAKTEIYSLAQGLTLALLGHSSLSPPFISVLWKVWVLRMISPSRNNSRVWLLLAERTDSKDPVDSDHSSPSSWYFQGLCQIKITPNS